jgi:hypothetical protein
MSLSDSCFEFVRAVRMVPTSDTDRRWAVRQLQYDIGLYSEPPFRYGDEIGMLREACSAFLLAATPAGAIDEPLRQLVFVCEAVQEMLDRPPNVNVVAS